MKDVRGSSTYLKKVDLQKGETWDFNIFASSSWSNIFLSNHGCSCCQNLGTSKKLFERLHEGGSQLRPKKKVGFDPQPNCSSKLGTTREFKQLSTAAVASLDGNKRVQSTPWDRHQVATKYSKKSFHRAPPYSQVMKTCNQQVLH